MKTLKQHINEALKIGKNLSDWTIHTCQPVTRKELKQIIKDRISKEGPNCNLNDIDVSLIDDMSWLFENPEFNGDISDWDVSNVKDMSYMFWKSQFNGDISNWDVSNVYNMYEMFSESNFNQDISKWKINKDCTVNSIFRECPIKEEYKPVLPE